jgi:hypothetical protein
VRKPLPHPQNPAVERDRQCHIGNCGAAINSVGTVGGKKAAAVISVGIVGGIANADVGKADVDATNGCGTEKADVATGGAIENADVATGGATAYDIVVGGIAAV